MRNALARCLFGRAGRVVRRLLVGLLRDHAEAVTWLDRFIEFAGCLVS